jgi:hypothetical protein
LNWLKPGDLFIPEVKYIEDWLIAGIIDLIEAF